MGGCGGEGGRRQQVGFGEQEGRGAAVGERVTYTVILFISFYLHSFV